MSHSHHTSEDHVHGRPEVSCCSDTGHGEGDKKKSGAAGFPRAWAGAIFSLFMLLTGLALDYLANISFFEGVVRLAWYVVAYLPVGWPVLVKGARAIARGDVFTEFFLMGIATLGAFALGEYPEGVAVMLFYTVGELFQHSAVHRARSNIQALLDIRPQTAAVLRDGKIHIVHPGEVVVGEHIQVKPGEQAPLDGELLSERGVFNTSALTGESLPAEYDKGKKILAGMVNLHSLVELRVTSVYTKSAISRILELVQNAGSRKARTEQFIRKFARVYTPVVTFMAVALVILPLFFVSDYVFRDWLYRALVFLVISCPCALVISIPLGYFGGIGAASTRGILFKGSNFLDLMAEVDTIVMDKTGTLTKGIFKVEKAVPADGAPAGWLALAAAMEQKSTHPIARAVVDYAVEREIAMSEPVSQEELPGMGLKGIVDSNEVLVGNARLMRKFDVEVAPAAEQEVNAVAHVAVNGRYAGYLVVADELKDDAMEAVKAMKSGGVKELIILSGDKSSVTKEVGARLGIEKAYGDLMPEQKASALEKLKSQGSRVVAFVGDGINDAPVLALADVGIAMGGLGSDVAIETADVVIQNDQLSRIAMARNIGRQTKKIVWQNIGLAFGIKILVLVLGAGGLATMWEAVFADVGVALLAILNAIRIRKLV